MEINLNFEELSPEDKLLLLDMTFDTIWGMILRNKDSSNTWIPENHQQLNF